MKKRILFFPQNNEHILNMNPVVEYLQVKGFECDYLDTQKIYKQSLVFDPRYNLVQVEFPSLENSFYHLGSISRVKYIRSSRVIIKTLIKDYDLFVFGNDGALQRLLLYYAKKENKYTVMILDGLVGWSGAYSLKDIFFQSTAKIKDIKNKIIEDFKCKVSVLFSGSSYSPYLPSVIGSSNLDEIYTIGKSSKEYIETHKHKDTKVFAYGLPRMRSYFKAKASFFVPRIPKSICFITSAYKWHGLDYFHKLQIADILLILECIKEVYPSDNTVKLYIKLHPREQKEDYAFLLNEENIELVENEPLTKTFANYSVLFSNISTCIVEGLNEGVQVSSIMINFPFWKFKNGFLKNKNIHKIFTKEVLMNTIKESLDTQEIKYIANPEHDFLSKDTLTSVENISQRVITLIKELT